MDVESVFSILKKEGKISKERIQGFLDDEYIDYLLDENILKEENDCYVVDNVKKAFYFGRGFANEKDFDTANQIFDCCYKLEPDNYLVNYQLFYRSLFSENNRIIFRYFNVVYPFLMKNGREKDASFYLLLLGYKYDIPSKYSYLRDEFNKIELNDILLDEDDKYFDVDRNDMRTYVYERKYYKISKSIDIVFDKKELDFEDSLEKELLLEAMVNHRKINKNIDKYILDNDLNGLNKYLGKQHRRRNLQVSSEYLYVVLNNYLNIKDTGVIPEIIKNDAVDTFEAIDANDFQKALKLLIDYNKEKHITNESPLFTILEKTSSLIDELKGKDIPQVKVEKKEEANEISLKDKNMVDSKIKAIRNGRILALLEPMEKERRNLIKSYVKDLDDIVAFSVGEEFERRVVLRYKINTKEHIDMYKLYQEAKEFVQQEHNYEEALKRYRILLSVGTPKVVNYGACGLTLMKLHREEEALECFKIGTMLAKEKGLQKDYSDIIDSILDKNKWEKEKETVDIELSDFDDNKTVDLESGFINDLIGLINEEEITLEEACKKLNLNDNQINYVKLLLARDYFYLGDTKNGEKILKEVTKAKDKTKEVKDLMKEINASKKYYPYRLNEERNQLVFIKK